MWLQTLSLAFRITKYHWLYDLDNTLEKFFCWFMGTKVLGVFSNICRGGLFSMLTRFSYGILMSVST